MATSMPLVSAEVETINVEEKEYAVKGYTLKQDLSNKKFTSEEIAHYLIDRFYICPICNKIQRGWALYEEKVDGIILRKFFLKCKHVFTTLTGLEVVDIEYKEMFVMWVKVETVNVQLIQRSDSILGTFIQYLQQAGSNSFNTANFYPIFMPIWVTGLSGSSTGFVAWGFNIGSGSSTYGIVIGTGNAPNTTSTYALESQIANGTGSGQMQYGATTTGNVTTSGNTISVTSGRTFTNNSGASITVAEVGVYMQAGGLYTNALAQWAFARDVLASPITVANTTPISVYYTFQLTIS